MGDQSADGWAVRFGRGFSVALQTPQTKVILLYSSIIDDMGIVCYFSKLPKKSRCFY